MDDVMTTRFTPPTRSTAASTFSTPSRAGRISFSISCSDSNVLVKCQNFHMNMEKEFRLRGSPTPVSVEFFLGKGQFSREYVKGVQAQSFSIWCCKPPPVQSMPNQRNEYMTCAGLPQKMFEAGSETETRIICSAFCRAP